MRIVWARIASVRMATLLRFLWNQGKTALGSIDSSRSQRRRVPEKTSPCSPANTGVAEHAGVQRLQDCGCRIGIVQHGYWHLWAVTQVVVDEEDVALLEGDLLRVRHLPVRQDGHHPLLVVDRLCIDDVHQIRS